jgi:membrane protein implicated in regulation of membrane protease activity
VLVYGTFAALIVLVAWATGGALGKAVIVAIVFFAAASAWNTYRWRARARDADRPDGESRP